MKLASVRTLDDQSPRWRFFLTIPKPFPNLSTVFCKKIPFDVDTMRLDLEDHAKLLSLFAVPGLVTINVMGPVIGLEAARLVEWTDIHQTVKQILRNALGIMPITQVAARIGFVRTSVTGEIVIDTSFLLCKDPAFVFAADKKMPPGLDPLCDGMIRTVISSLVRHSLYSLYIHPYGITLNMRKGTLTDEMLAALCQTIAHAGSAKGYTYLGDLNNANA